MKHTKVFERTLRCAILGALGFLAAIPAAAELPPSSAARPVYSIVSNVDWKARVIEVDVTLDLAAAGLRLPDARLEALRMIERDIPSLAKDVVFALQADSHRKIEDAVSDDSVDPEAFVGLASLATIESSAFSKDMRFFLARYSLSLDAIASLLVTGASPTAIRAPLETVQTKDYTGIIVYAKGSLPVHGEAVEGQAEPCLFPRIFDSDMNVVLDKSLVVPEALAHGGVLGYASAIGVEAGSRVGSDPMRIMAVGLFGDRRTDYIISREDALRILSSAANRELLREGKVVVVY